MEVDLAVEPQCLPDRGLTPGALGQPDNVLLHSLIDPGVYRLCMDQVATVNKVDKPCTLLILGTKKHLEIRILCVANGTFIWTRLPTESDAWVSARQQEGTVLIAGVSGASRAANVVASPMLTASCAGHLMTK